MEATRSQNIPSHTLYDDDIMVFSKGNMASIQAVSKLLHMYALCLGQKVNPTKSIIYAGSMNSHRLNLIATKLVFWIGHLLFLYSGAPIFKGRQKKVHFKSIIDKLKERLASLKSSLLSIVVRLLMFKFVLQGMLMHTLLVYSWPNSLLKDTARWCRNFIWSGDTETKKLVNVAWSNCCKSFEARGLGFRSFIVLNDSSNMVQCWNMSNSTYHWAREI